MYMLEIVFNFVSFQGLMFLAFLYLFIILSDAFLTQVAMFLDYLIEKLTPKAIAFRIATVAFFVGAWKSLAEGFKIICESISFSHHLPDSIVFTSNNRSAEKVAA